MINFVFAIDEAGTYAYLEPLFLKWMKTGKAGWGILAGKDVISFSRYKSLKDKLPAITLDQAKAEGKIFITSLGQASEELRKIYDHAQNHTLIGIVDIWDKVWNEDIMPEHLFVIDEEQKNQISYSLPLENIHIIGQPAWESASDLPKALEKTIVFVGQPIRKHYGRSLGYDEDSAWTLLKPVADEGRYNVSYALHPAQIKDEITDLIGADAMIYEDISRALAENETIISPFSSALFDAWLGGGRKVISLQPLVSRNKDKCYLSRSNLIPLAHDKGSLKQALDVPAIQNTENRFKGSLDHLEAELERLL